MTKHRIAIVGTGGIAHLHAEALNELSERIELVAGVDVDAERARQFCEKHGIARPFTDTGEMLRDARPDIVHICTPPGLHCQLSVQCLEGGAWVLCEKPLCASLREFDRITEAEEQTGNFCSSVFQWRFGSAGQHFKSLIEKEALGHPLVGLCNTLWFRSHEYYEVPWRGKWDTELGGPTMGHGIHAMDLFLWLLGDWKEVQAMADTLDRKIEVEDVSLALVKFQSGAVGSITNSILSPRQETYLRFDFQQATVELSHLYAYNNANWRFSAPEDAPDEEKQRIAGLSEAGANVTSNHRAQAAALLDSFEKGERPLISGGEARRTIEFLSALYKAAATGQKIKAGSLQPGDPFYEHVGGTLAQNAFAARTGEKA